MIASIFIAILFTIAYPLKGGQGGAIFTNWKRVRARHVIYDRLLDGKVISTLIVFLGLSGLTFLTHANIGNMPNQWMSVVWITALWLLAVAPSMGEEQAAIYNSLTNNPYQRYPDDFGRMYGIKKGVQRGVWMGACMTMATGCIWFIPASLAYVPIIWVTHNYGPNNKLDNWGWGEVFIGAICFGVPMVIHVSNII